MEKKYKFVEVRAEDVIADREQTDGVVTTVSLSEPHEETNYAVVYDRALNRYMAIVPLGEVIEFEKLFGWE